MIQENGINDFKEFASHFDQSNRQDHRILKDSLRLLFDGAAGLPSIGRSACWRTATAWRPLRGFLNRDHIVLVRTNDAEQLVVVTSSGTRITISGTSAGVSALADGLANDSAGEELVPAFESFEFMRVGWFDFSE